MKRKALTKRQNQAIETRNQIYDAAIELMDRKGYENITIAEIAKKANVSVGSFYHYFKSKNDILVEIFKRGDDYFAREVAAKLGTESSPKDIVTYFDYYARFCLDTGLATDRQIYRPTVKPFIKKGRPMLVILNSIITRGQQRGEISKEMSAEEITTMLFVFARGLLFDWCLRDGKYDLRARMRQYIKRIVSTIQAQ
ncbi:MAG: TetR/AcrR family transcriptional regulator [Deltaproteobacteria bacterium]|nr:TetR/AcrR family transcriptional regulator [Deltaproteobacteria bacterium]